MPISFFGPQNSIPPGDKIMDLPLKDQHHPKRTKNKKTKDCMTTHIGWEYG